MLRTLLRGIALLLGIIALAACEEAVTTEAEPVVAAPGRATSPTPSNGATGVPSGAITFTWTRGTRATTSNLYFGSSSRSLELVSRGLTGRSLSYNPSRSTSTRYYWRVDSVNAGGTTRGTVWSFTTAAATLVRPERASNPTPGSLATGVSRTTNLSWSAGARATSRDVYFGTDSTPDSGERVLSGTTATTYNPGTLRYSTTYWWRVDEKNSAGTTTGVIWRFTTQAQPVPLPTKASNPTPSDGQTNIRTANVYLSFTPGSGTSRRVYIGTSRGSPATARSARGRAVRPTTGESMRSTAPAPPAGTSGASPRGPPSPLPGAPAVHRRRTGQAGSAATLRCRGARAATQPPTASTSAPRPARSPCERQFSAAATTPARWRTARGTTGASTP